MVSIHRVRVTNDPKGDVYMMRKSWALDELKMVDGVDSGPVIPVLFPALISAEQ
jgi:hypothetical protein